MPSGRPACDAPDRAADDRVRDEGRHPRLARTRVRDPRGSSSSSARCGYLRCARDSPLRTRAGGRDPWRLAGHARRRARVRRTRVRRRDPRPARHRRRRRGRRNEPTSRDRRHERERRRLHRPGDGRDDRPECPRGSPIGVGCTAAQGPEARGDRGQWDLAGVPVVSDARSVVANDRGAVRRRANGDVPEARDVPGTAHGRRESPGHAHRVDLRAGTDLREPSGPAALPANRRARARERPVSHHSLRRRSRYDAAGRRSTEAARSEARRS